MPSLIHIGERALDKSDNTHRSKSLNCNLELLLEQVARAIDRHDLPSALRLADRARRIASKNSSCILLYARLLIQSGLAEEALKHLTDKNDPNVLLARGMAFFELGFLDKASRYCSDLLKSLSVDAVEGLPAFASRLCQDSRSTGSCGWIGVNDQLQLVGAVSGSRRVDIEFPAGTYHPAKLSGGRESVEAFVCILPGETSGRVTVRGDNCDFLGSGLLWPPEFKPSAWVALEGENLVGEAKLGWSPKLPLTLAISNPGGLPHRTISANSDHLSTSCSFSSSLSRAELGSSQIEVTAILPNGATVPVLGSPLTLGHRPAVTLARPDRLGSGHSFRYSAASPTRARIVDIVVPVYAGQQETLVCLESLFKSMEDEEAEIVVVNDASPEPELTEALHRLAADERISLITNPSNLGFAGAANRGMKLHPDRDVILLNSDTEVFGDWIQRLKSSACTSADIGTVTPMGESGSITDYLRQGARVSATSEEIDRIASKVNAGRAIEIPVGVGFCMYIKRECLDQTGELDAETFGRGYGEENDFCLRARALGWRHVAATDVFIGHHGGRSFGELKTILTKRNSRVLNSLYSGYAGLVEAFLAADPLFVARREIDIRRLLERALSPVLLITHDLSGGVERHISQRKAELNTSGRTVLILRRFEQPFAPADSTVKLKLTVESFGLENLVFDVSSELALLERFLRAIGLAHIEIHHFLRLPAHLLETALRLNVPYDIYIHDYSWICPRIALIGGSGRYCHEPALNACEACIQSHGSAMEESLTVAELRERSAKQLSHARRVVFPTTDARKRFARYFPERAFETIPWESVTTPTMQRRSTSVSGARVAVIGAIGIPKGYQILLDCARDAAARNLDLEFIVIGYTVDDQPLLDTGHVFITGPYQEDELQMLLDREDCNIALFPSVSPETWCYSLTHAMNRGMPIFAFDLGAQAERLREYSGAELLLPSSDSEKVNLALIESVKRLTNWPEQEEGAMDQIELAEQQQSKETQSDDLVSSVQILKLPQGIYSFKVKESGSAPKLSESLALPALQVGIAPIRSSGNIEFLTSASALDRWLAYKSDMIVVKIAGGEASLLLTSVRTQDSPSLAVAVERLNAQAASPPVALTEAAPALGGAPDSLEVRLLAHIRYVGDLSFECGSAGWPGQQMWIEGFAILSVGNLPADCLEYRGLVADGFQTPWLRNQTLCGSRGGAIPLLGYAVRVKPELADRYECAYSGRFFSGAHLGPMKDGAFCISELAGDPLEAIEVHVHERQLAPASIEELGVTPIHGELHRIGSADAE
jgi:GT2 family glycosyltransferase/glycosyltransferase involved in cell wall biosynthesis